jgi:predicted permease
MLSMMASACALAMAAWGVAGAKAMLPAGMFRADTIALNGRVFVMSIVAAVASGLLFGMAPAWIASRASLVAVIKDGGPTGTARRSLRTGLLAAQIGCITVLLVVSTLFVASFVRVLRVDLGFDRAHLLGIEPRAPFRGTADEVERRLRTVPGVVDVAVVTSTSLPLLAPVFGGGYNVTAVRSVGGSGASPEVLVYRVTPNYFAVTGLPFRRGSTWQSTAATRMTPVVIDEVVARRLFGDADPLGRLITGDGLRAEFTIVGVVPFVRSRGPEDVAQPAMYAPHTADPSRRYAGFFVRTKDDPRGVMPLVQSVLTDLAPAGDRPYMHVVDEAVRQLTATRRFNATLMSLFALFAVFIGAAGIYGVMASLVAQRKREFGVRIALGASKSDIRRGLLAEVGRHLAVGLALGLPAAWWLSRGFAALFFEVRPTDLSIYLIVVVLLAAVAVVAALVPARRASRVDPIVSLRGS